MNTSKPSWAPVYRMDRQPVEKVTLDDLDSVGVPFSSYGINPGDKLEFFANPEVVRQAPRREGQRPSYLVACVRNGVKSWFNPTFFTRIDANQQPLYPAWSALGSAKAIIEKLIEMKSIETSKDKTFTVQMTAFNQDGSFKTIPRKDDSGNLVLGDDGAPILDRTTETSRPYPVIADPK